MAKIEVLTELLVDELNEFQKGIKTLESVNDNIKKAKIEPNLSNLNQCLTDFTNQQKRFIENQNSILKSIDKNRANRNSYPNWLLGLLSTVLIGFIVFSIYAFYSVQHHENTLVESGRQEAITYFQSFINSKASILEEYKSWKQSKSK